MRRRRPTKSSELRRSLGFSETDCVVGFTGHVRRLARHRRAGGRHPANLRGGADGEVPDHRRRHAQAAARRRGRAPSPRRPGAAGRPRAAGRGRAAAEGVRPLRVAAQHPHGRQQVLRIADQDLRIHGDGRRHRRERSGTDRRGAVAGAARRRRSSAADVTVTDERSVLCTPGSVDEFVAGVVGLARRPEIAAALGRNARQAVADHYSWERHVARLWRFASELAPQTCRTPHRDRRRLQGPGSASVEQQSGGLGNRPQRAAADARVVPRG